MPAVFSQPREMVFFSLASSVFVASCLLQRRVLNRYREQVGEERSIDDTAVKSTLFSQLRIMTRIALPKVICRESLYTMVFILLFVLKAFLNVVRTTTDSQIIQGLLTAKTAPERIALTKRSMANFMAASLLYAVVNGLIQTLRHHLIAMYRETLTRHFHEKFFAKMTYYHAKALDDRIEDCHTCITEYCHEFAEHFAELPYYFVLPALEAGMAMFYVVKDVGTKPAAVMSSIVTASIFAIRYLSPKFGKIHATVMAKEEHFRHAHRNLHDNCEQIAMQNGGTFMKKKLNGIFEQVRDAEELMAVAKGHFNSLQTAISKGLWEGVGTIVCAWKLIGGENQSTNSILSSVVIHRRLVAKFHFSVQEFVNNFKEMSHLSEFTEKLATFDRVLDDIAASRCTRGVDRRLLAPDGSFRAMDKNELYLATKNRRPLLAPEADKLTKKIAHTQSGLLGTKVSEESEAIGLVNVSVVTPNNVTLIRNLNMSIRKDDHWLVVGGNGCGKSSMLRVLSGLWPVATGTIYKDKAEIFFLSQDAYLLPEATMLEQICYPDVVPTNDDERAQQMKFNAHDALWLATGNTILEQLDLEWAKSPCIGIAAGAVDRSFAWESELSGGQRQKLALARMFFHLCNLPPGKLPVACMDESTSQMDPDSRRTVYENLRSKRIAYLTVSHHIEDILPYHHKILRVMDNEDWLIGEARTDGQLTHSHSACVLDIGMDGPSTLNSPGRSDLGNPLASKDSAAALMGEVENSSPSEAQIGILHYRSNSESIITTLQEGSRRKSEIVQT